MNYYLRKLGTNDDCAFVFGLDLLSTLQTIVSDHEVRGRTGRVFFP